MFSELQKKIKTKFQTDVLDILYTCILAKKKKDVL